MGTIGGEVKCKKCGDHTLWSMRVLSGNPEITASSCKCEIPIKDKLFNQKYRIEL